MQHKTKKIGFLGGTFDPLHNGHIHLALTLQERWGLHEVWFNPAACSPFKLDRPPFASFEKRYQMLKAALKHYPSFRVLDLERDATAPVYTVDAILKCLKQENVDPNDLYLILADDALIHFTDWKEAKKLALLAQPLTGMRRHQASPEELLKPFTDDPILYERFKKGLTLMPILEISSTNIRERLHDQLTCLHLIPPEVDQYIRKEKLYCGEGENYQHFQKQKICL